MPFDNRNQRLNGLNPLAYMGDNAYQPPEFVTDNRPPTINDSLNFELGTIWLDRGTNNPPTAEDVWMLVALNGGNATWINFAGTSALESLTGNSGGPVFGDANDNINVIGDGTTITIAGNPGTNTLTASVATIFAATYTTDDGNFAVPVAYNLNVFGGDNIFTTSAGDTVTISVAGTTNHSVQVGNAAGSLTSIPNGTTGQVLTAVTGADPVWSNVAGDFSTIVVQTFTSSGTYTPTANMKYCTIEVVGGGGGGGATTTTNGVGISAAGGGGGGGYARITVPAATIGASKAVTIGAGGAGGTVPGGAGSTGGTTSVGAIVSATGGIGGSGSAMSPTEQNLGGPGGVGSSGDLNANGGPGGIGAGLQTAGSGIVFSGCGGNSIFGGGAFAVGVLLAVGQPGTSYGGGGSGSAISINSTQQAGGAGADGIVIITEFVS